MNTQRESCHERINLISVPSDTAMRLYYFVQWTGHFICKSDFYIKRSCFDSFLLLYTVSGSGTLHYGGGEYLLTGGSAALIDCTKLHEYYPNDDRWEFKYVHYNGSASAEFYDHITKLHGSPVVYGVTDAEESFDRILALVKESGAEERCSERIYRLLMRLIGAAEEKKTQDSDSRVKCALVYIAENYSRPISVTDLADAAHLSRCHFSVEFKKHTGFTPYCYILRYRIAAAKRFLYTTDKTVDEISGLCGFADTTTFIRAFRRMTGLSPTAYRNHG